MCDPGLEPGPGKKMLWKILLEQLVKFKYRRLIFKKYYTNVNFFWNWQWTIFNSVLVGRKPMLKYLGVKRTDISNVCSNSS